MVDGPELAPGQVGPRGKKKSPTNEKKGKIEQPGGGVHQVVVNKPNDATEKMGRFTKPHSLEGVFGQGWVTDCGKPR